MPSVSSLRRHPDPSFEKLMSTYKHLLKVLSIRDLILSSLPQTLTLAHLSHPSTHLRLGLNKGPAHFIRCFPHVFSLLPDPTTLRPSISLTPAASLLSRRESAAANAAADDCARRLARVLMMSRSKTVPMRAVFRVWREMGLPDEFEERVLKERRDLFRVRENPNERGTHLIEFVGGDARFEVVESVEVWRRKEERSKKADELEHRYGFKQEFPPGMRLTKNYRARLKEWQRLPYVGPYEQFDGGGKRSKEGMKKMEKRAVGIVHEFLSLTVEKMAEVEQVSQFRKWFGIDLNIRDLFLDHPGIFYVSCKGKRHTVFLREAYRKGRLIEPNLIYDARMKLLELVAMRRRGQVFVNDSMGVSTSVGATEEDEEEEGEDYY